MYIATKAAVVPVQLVVVASVLTGAMISEEVTLHKAAEAEEAKTRPLVLISL